MRGWLRQRRCATRQAGRLRNSGLRPSNSPRRLPPARLRCSPLQMGAPERRLGFGALLLIWLLAHFYGRPQKPGNSTPLPSRERSGEGWVSSMQGYRLTPQKPISFPPEKHPISLWTPLGPLGRCRATEKLAEKGRGLFEGRRPEFRSPRQFRVAQGTGRSPAPNGGRLFFGDFLLAKQKKVTRAASAKPSQKPGQRPNHVRRKTSAPGFKGIFTVNRKNTPSSPCHLSDRDPPSATIKKQQITFIQSLNTWHHLC